MSRADWDGATVPTMWNSAQAADTQMAWQQVKAWQQTYELLVHHEGRLKSCRDQLIYAWPPERSPAATVFVDYIDGLLEAIGRAKEDAVSNHKALAGVLGSLVAAKADMAKLKAEWDQQEAQDGRPVKNLSRVYPYGSVADPNWREDLNQRARKRMAQNDQEVLEASRGMIELTPPDGRVGGGGGNLGPGNLGGASGIGLGTESAGERGPDSPWMQPSRVALPSEVESSIGLAGAAVVPPGGSLNPAVPSTGAINDSRPSSPSGLAPAFGASNSALPPSSRYGTAAGLPGAKRGIGAVAGGFRGHPSWSQQLGAGVARGFVNPVGGVIEGGAPVRSGISGIPVAPVAAAGGHGQGETGREPSAVLHWDVAEGVAPVIEPDIERKFDLGPGVIGVDG